MSISEGQSQRKTGQYNEGEKKLEDRGQEKRKCDV